MSTGTKLRRMVCNARGLSFLDAVRPKDCPLRKHSGSYKAIDREILRKAYAERRRDREDKKASS